MFMIAMVGAFVCMGELCAFLSGGCRLVYLWVCNLCGFVWKCFGVFVLIYVIFVRSTVRMVVVLDVWSGLSFYVGVTRVVVPDLVVI